MASLSLSALAAALWGTPAAASAIDCPRRDDVVLAIDFLDAEVKRDFSKTVAEINAERQRVQPRQALARIQTLGLSIAEMSYTTEVSTRTQRLPSGRYCGQLVKAQVKVGYSARRVLIAREIPAGTCIHEQVLAHELRHVAIDSAALDEMRQKLALRLQPRLQRIESVTADSQMAVAGRVRDIVTASLKEATDDIGKARDAHQVALDSPGEYRTVLGSCNGELQRYIGRRVMMERAGTPSGAAQTPSHHELNQKNTHQQQ